MNIIETNFEFNGALKTRQATNRIILHNSGVTVLQSAEVIHNYHKNHNGWAGIGYHLYIRKDGTVYRGRPLNTIGAHAGKYVNPDSIGICFEGNFNVETMNDVQKEAGKQVIADLKNIYGNLKIQGHKEVCNTDCPGANFPLNELKEIEVVKQETKSVADIANEVIAGKWDVYPRRKELLENAGYNYSEVQAKVNEILLGKKPATIKPKKEITKGSKVLLKYSAENYCTGERIPTGIKNKYYTVMQIGSKSHPNGILLQEIMSWVNKNDVQ